MPTGCYLKTKEHKNKISRTLKETLSKLPKKDCSGANNNFWKGGIYIINGYKYFWSAKFEKIAEHRLVMEKYLGRKLNSDEIIHHINGNKLDNRIENLELTNRSKHIKIHISELHEKLKSLRNINKNIGNVKIRFEERKNIVNKVNMGISKRALAIYYGVSLTQIYRILQAEKKNAILL